MLYGLQRRLAEIDQSAEIDDVRRQVGSGPRWVGIFDRMSLVGRRTGNVMVCPNSCSACCPLTKAQISQWASVHA